MPGVSIPLAPFQDRPLSKTAEIESAPGTRGFVGPKGADVTESDGRVRAPAGPRRISPHLRQPQRRVTGLLKIGREEERCE